MSRRSNKTLGLNVESLEDRACPAGINLAAGLVTITGSLDDDFASVYYVTDPSGPMSVAPTPWTRVDLNAGGDAYTQVYLTAAITDKVLFHASSGHDYFRNHTLLESEAWGGSGSDRFFGGGGPDHLMGDGDNDVLDGGEGDDTLTGGNGFDYLVGGKGNDWMRGGDHDDWLIGDDGDDRLYGGDGNDILEGRDGNDILTGDTGRNVLVGGRGSDFLRATTGEDLLIGSEVSFVNRHNALTDIAEVWRSARSYKKRLMTITDPSNDFALLHGISVIDDFASDTLVGADGGIDDVYFDGVFDVVGSDVGEQIV